MGNPFEIPRDGLRDDVCNKFDKWFNFCLRDPRFKREVLKMKGQKLGCFCKEPDREVRCHCDTIANYLNSLVVPKGILV